MALHRNNRISSKCIESLKNGVSAGGPDIKEDKVHVREFKSDIYKVCVHSRLTPGPRRGRARPRPPPQCFVYFEHQDCSVDNVRRQYKNCMSFIK